EPATGTRRCARPDPAGREHQPRPARDASAAGDPGSRRAGLDRSDAAAAATDTDADAGAPMIGHLSHRERTLVAGCVIVVVAVGLWEFGVQPIREQNQTAAELIPARERTLQRRQDLIATRTAVTRELEQTN